MVNYTLKTGSGVSNRSGTVSARKEPREATELKIGISTDVLWYNKMFHWDRQKLTKDVRRGCRVSVDHLYRLVLESRWLWERKCATGWCRRSLFSSAVLLLLSLRMASLMWLACRSLVQGRPASEIYIGLGQYVNIVHRLLCSGLFYRKGNVLSVIYRRYIGWNIYIHYQLSSAVEGQQRDVIVTELRVVLLFLFLTICKSCKLQLCIIADFLIKL